MTPAYIRSNIDACFSYSSVHSLVHDWIKEGRIGFSGHISIEKTDDLDPIIFKLCDMPFNPKKGTPAQILGFMHMADVTWARSPHAFTLFRAKCIKLGISAFGTENQHDQ